MKTIEHIQDTLIHKQLVIESGLILIKYLEKHGREDDATQLARRCVRHDNSKLESDEMKQFLKLPAEKENMKDARKEMPNEVKRLVEMHWKHNRHHPEFFEDYHDMTDVDIMEMVCDWHARSAQFNTNFMDFIITRQQNRFNFDEEFFRKVLDYCEILVGESTI